ncbi:hypothetical protein [Streptomyces pseudovenezuelae]|uniref:hypothetical protein n=1 Tax=Streptomyces pseudovenezuelae TaxID=67350 RepID=UPI002E816296|nr:hypothetical protein [Streptomyces pseudovenezuelae]WUA91010.1 hypothetical protein OHO81_28580 [Streptomyces pseudovenezuelae]
MRKRLPSLRSALRLPGRQTATRALVAAVLAVAGVLHRWQRGMVSLFAKGQRWDEETAGASGTLTLPG